MEIQQYLKTSSEFKRGSEVFTQIQISYKLCIRQCGYLCLFVLKLLTNGEKFQSILNHMRHYGYAYKVIGKIPFKPKKGFVLPKHRFTGPCNPLQLQLDSKITHYREMSHIMLLMLFPCVLTSAIEITINQLENVNVSVKC